MEMEKITLPKFDHDADNLEASLGLTDKVRDYVRNAIIFECLACPIMAAEFFDKESDVPGNLRTMGGVLERIDTHMRDFEEQFYMMLIFADVYHSLHKIVNKAMDNSEIDKNSETFDKILGTILAKITGQPVVSISDCIVIIRDCSFDFDKFLVRIMKEEDYDVAGSFVRPETLDIDPEQIGDLLKDMLAKALEEKKKREQSEKKKGKDKPEEDNQ